jgi:hypothetical protein
MGTSAGSFALLGGPPRTARFGRYPLDPTVLFVLR